LEFNVAVRCVEVTGFVYLARLAVAACLDFCRVAALVKAVFFGAGAFTAFRVEVEETPLDFVPLEDQLFDVLVLRELDLNELTRTELERNPPPLNRANASSINDTPFLLSIVTPIPTANTAANTVAFNA